jgi:hypothetical protein
MGQSAQLGTRIETNENLIPYIEMPNASFGRARKISVSHYYE